MRQNCKSKMPYLSDVKYSRATTVAAITGYFGFLGKMYLNESDILRPPEGGWPGITHDRFKDLGKTDEVISLLRHIPYLRPVDHDFESVDAGPCRVRFFSWLQNAWLLFDMPGLVPVEDLEGAFEDMKIMTEEPDYGFFPPHVVGLIRSKHDAFILDTQLGVVYWLNCPGEIRHSPTAGVECILDDAYEYAPEDEADWRSEPAWAITDFFEVLKNCFRQLWVIPVSPSILIDMGTYLDAENRGVLSLLQAVYHEHGWPEIDRYRKEDCLQAVCVLLMERYGQFCQQMGL
ncbi:hypothetical protein VTI28DRAFT_8110 [Corynascus sepedonium]